MNLSIRSERNKQYSTLYLKGEVDVYTAPKLKEELYLLLENPDHHVLVDLAEVEYMDSSGLGMIIGALKLARISSSRMTIQGTNQRIQRLFEITGLAEFVETKTEEAEEKS